LTFGQQPHHFIKVTSPMPSPRYYQQQAKTLLTWAKATKDKACARRLRVQAAAELEHAEQAREAVTDLNPLLAEFNTQQLLKGR
jgi:hypothetical protein